MKERDELLRAEVEYRPDGIGYQQAKAHFESIASLYNNRL